ncbi:MAG: hypothetical protein D6820_18450, partial [Lentisphaerae bacterium]
MSPSPNPQLTQILPDPWLPLVETLQLSLPDAASDRDADIAYCPLPLEYPAMLKGIRDYAAAFARQLSRQSSVGTQIFLNSAPSSIPSPQDAAIHIAVPSFIPEGWPIPPRHTPVLPPPPHLPSPQPGQQRISWAVCTPHPSPLRTRIIEVASTVAPGMAASPCLYFPPPAIQHEENPWLHPAFPHAYNDQPHQLIERVTHYLQQTANLLHAADFILCPLIPEHTFPDLILAMQHGKIPVLITDHPSLPAASDIPWDRCAIIIGSNLETLPAILSRDPREFDPIRTAARDAASHRFTPARYRHSLELLTTAPASAPPLAKSGQAADHHSPLQKFWDRIAALPNLQRILIYGAGKLTRALLDALARCQQTPSFRSPHILAIADDNPATHGTAIQGISIIPLEAAKLLAPDAIVLGTDAFIPAMRQRCQRMFPPSIPILTINSVFSTEDGAAETFFLPQAHESSVATPLHCKHQPARIIPLPAQSVEAIITCVGYGDILAKTLPHNLPQLDHIIVLTTPGDEATIQTVNALDSDQISLVITDAAQQEGAPFNKGRLMNCAIPLLRHRQWCLSLDADIILPPDFRRYIHSHRLHPNVLYCMARHNIVAENLQQWLEEYLRSRRLPSPPSPQGYPTPFGYFQLFHLDAPAVRERYPNIFPRQFLNAGGVDFYFARLFAAHPQCAIVPLPLKAIHVPHGGWGQNWQGRKSPALDNT